MNESRADFPWNTAIFLTSLILLFIWVLHLEWSYSDDYQYGWVVAPGVLLTLYLRWSNRPDPELGDPKRSRVVHTLITLLALGSLPFFIVYAAGPEFRGLLWVFGFWVVLIGLLNFYLIGGFPWLLHFAFPWAILLVSIPWPEFIHAPLVNGLMGFVAIGVSEILVFFGIFAEATGNLIQLSNGSVGIDQACSGIRSFQLSFTFGIFLGEVFRFGYLSRAIFVLVSLCFAFFINIIRSLLLSLLFDGGGQELMNEWHDTIGIVVMFFLVSFLYAIASLYDHFFNHHQAANESKIHLAPTNCSIKLQDLSRSTTVLWISIGIASFFLSELWYRLRSPQDGGLRLVALEERLPNSWNRIFLPDQVKEVLRYSHAVSGTFETKGSLEPVAFHLFTWEPGKISSSVTGHSPDICLPSAGWSLVATLPTKTLTFDELDISIAITPYQFESPSGDIVHSFWAIWDRLGSTEIVGLGDGYGTRIVGDALAGRRIDGRQTLNIIYFGNQSPEQKWADFEQVSKQFLSIQSIR
ncbi:MAG: exosortase/archaeosortase family protein [Puniceicoccaceae bacterium]